MSDARERVQQLYRRSDACVRGAGFDAGTAAAQFGKYVTFVSAFASSGRLLDVGVGSGWSSELLAQRGFDVVGVDLNAAAFEPRPRERLSFVQGGALGLPFASASFDVVATHEMLEHVPDPGRVLEELLRVAKPGGLVIVVSPNLLSLLASARALALHVWRQPVRQILLRGPTTPRHPGGNTLPEVLAWIPYKSWLAATKLLRSSPTFTMREPDVRPPFHADNDASYLVNPIDLVRWFRAHGCEIVRNGFIGRPSALSILAAGTFVCARKPA